MSDTAEPWYPIPPDEPYAGLGEALVSASRIDTVENRGLTASASPSPPTAPVPRIPRGGLTSNDRRPRESPSGRSAGGRQE